MKTSSARGNFRGPCEHSKNPANKIAEDFTTIHELLNNLKIKNSFSKDCLEVLKSIQKNIRLWQKSSESIVSTSNSFRRQTLHMIMDSVQVFKMSDIVNGTFISRKHKPLSIYCLK